MRFSWLCICSCLIAGVSGPAFARATTFSPGQNNFTSVTMSDEPVVSEDKPVLLTADRMRYQQQENIVIASGKVEIVQGDTVVLCDELVYDRTHSRVNARGNVSVMDQTGNVIFADEIELRDGLSTGVIEQFKSRMNDDSLFAAVRAERVDENILLLDQALYSPCKVKCAEDVKEGETPKAPFWQMRAQHVTIDNEKQTVVYNNAWMELFGYPIFYTPYLSHATPNADGKSGLLVPEFQRSEVLGNIYRIPVYYAIAPDRSALFTPTQTSKEGWLLRADYRQKYNNGQVNIDSSITHPRNRDASGNLTHGRQGRGHFFALGEFDEGENSKWGFDLKRTTDDTYMRKYGIDGSTLLQSRIYGETYDFVGSSNRSALSAEGVAFQGLAASDDARRIPLALPLVNFAYESDPGAYGSRYYMNNNALVLTRDIGSETRRLSNMIGWRLPYITDNGQVIEFNTRLRGDIYDVSNVTLTNGQNFNGVTGRLVPEASVLWRMPFLNQFENTSVIVEPVVNVAVSPSGGNTEKIPNEDSLVPEFTDTNLFSDNRFAGYDRIEHGPRVSYGMRGLMNYKNTYVDGLFGQHYRQQEDRNFPFSNDLTDNLSDYVGKLGLQYSPFYVAYRFRLDKNTLTSRRKELDMQYSGKRFSMTTSYLLLQNDPIFASREELANTASVEVTKNWVLSGLMRRDLEIDQLTNLGGELLFKNECVNVSAVVNRSYARDREVKPDTKYLVRLSLKNLN